MSEHFPILKEMRWVIADARSLIKRGIEEGRVEPGHLAELEDLDQELDAMLNGSIELCTEYVDAEAAGIVPKLSDQELVSIMRQRVAQAEEWESRAKTILDAEF